MFKKISIIIILFFIFFSNNSFADPTGKTQEEQIIENNKGYLDVAEKKFNDAQQKLEKAQKVYDTSNLENESLNEQLLDKAKKNAITAQNNLYIEKTNYNKTLSEKGTQKQQAQGTEWLAKDAQSTYNKILNEDLSCSSEECRKAKSNLDKTKIAAQVAKKAYDEGPESVGDITSPGYQIMVNDISPGMKVNGDTTKVNVNYVLGSIIKNMMILLGSLALLIMTIGGGYIVLHHGQDELLSKGKSIFMSGVYALVVALSSYYLVDIFRNILYK